MVVFKLSPGNPVYFKHGWIMKVLAGIFAVCCLLATSYIASRLSSIPMKSLFEGKHIGPIPLRDDFIQVLIVTEESRLIGALALVNSIISNTESPVHFYFITDLKSSNELHSWIENSALHDVSYEIKVVNANEFVYPRNLMNDSSLDSTLVHIPKLFPQATGRLIVLSDDIIVQSDIAKLNNVSIGENHFGALSEDCDTLTRVFSKNKSRYYHYLDLKNPSLREKNLDGKKCIFNIGVMVLNMTLWKEQQVTDQLLHWIDLDKKENLFYIDSVLSPFLIVFYDKISHLSNSWHIRHLGVTSGTRYSREYLEDGHLLRWDGRFKPWKHKIPYADLWRKYSVARPKSKLQSASNLVE